MRPAETIATLASFENRGAGSDAERRAAIELASVLDRERIVGRRETVLEPFWCRPNWALTHAWHAALGLAGSLVATTSARVGGAMVLVALLSLLADALTGVSLGRRLTPERASQNVISEGSPGPGDEHNRVRLVITANYDAGRTGLLYRDRVRRAVAALANASGRRAPGWLGWLTIALGWVLAVAIVRVAGHKGTALGAAQLIPTVGLVLALAALLELATAGWGPAANDNASGVGAAIALVRALDAAAPRRLAVDLVLQGAGDGEGIGLRRYLRARRSSRRAPNTIVLGLAASGGGAPVWFLSDGALVPLVYFRQLRLLCSAVAADESQSDARPYRGRGATPALPARWRRLPAIALGARDRLGMAPRSHQTTDTPQRVDPRSVDRVVEFALLLVDQIDAYLAHRAAPAHRHGDRPPLKALYTGVIGLRFAGHSRLFPPTRANRATSSRRRS